MAEPVLCYGVKYEQWKQVLRERKRQWKWAIFEEVPEFLDAAEQQ